MQLCIMHVCANNVVHHKHVQALVDLAVDCIPRPLMLAKELTKVLLEKHRRLWALRHQLFGPDHVTRSNM